MKNCWCPSEGITIACPHCGTAYTLYPQSGGLQGGIYSSALDWCLICEAPIQDWGKENQASQEGPTETEEDKNMTPADIKALRQRLQLRQADLQALLGMRSCGALSLIESGANSISGPTAHLLQLLAECPAALAYARRHWGRTPAPVDVTRVRKSHPQKAQGKK